MSFYSEPKHSRIAMADDLSFAKQGLADWARSNGIYQVRDALTQAASMAGKASSGEELADLILAGAARELESEVPAATGGEEAPPSKDSTRAKAVKK